MLVFDPNDLQNGDITLKFRYTVAPSAGDFQTIYSQMKKDEQNLMQPMIDVRITDVAPTPQT